MSDETFACVAIAAAGAVMIALMALSNLIFGAAI